MEAKEFYTNTKNGLVYKQKKLEQRKSIFALARLGNILAIIGCFYFLWNINKLITFFAGVILVFVFIQIVYKDLANRAAIKHLQFLILINNEELDALEGKFSQFEDGIQYLPKDHFYANDMDIFGRASLYQFLNRTTSQLGSEKLATWLLNPTNVNNIPDKQLGVKELKEATDWRQHLQALGKESSIKKNTLQNIISWLKEPQLFIQSKHWQWLRYFLPAIIIAVTGLYIFDYIKENTWYVALFIFAAIAFQINKMVAPLHNKLSGMVNDLNILSESIAIIEKQHFNSPLLQQLQSNLKSEQHIASLKIKQLKNILDRLDLRYNIVIAVPLNIFLQWNLQQILNLEKWKKENDSNVALWFDVLAEFEALNSFATLHFNNPDYCFPSFKDKHFYISANNLGHPLIHKNKRVNNFIDINTAGEVMLVTGSNMAGKSTYLRSIGVNVVLAMAGAPVCASKFELSPVQLISSMRIADNLEESTSTFYAELKKLKTVIEKINAGEKVFVLLDEILRGTNSLDRHTGSEALIRQLIKQKAAAILATHDVELAALENEFPENILNFHFDAQTKGEELFFDYKLKEGVCTNMNASLLMKKIGLEI